MKAIAILAAAAALAAGVPSFAQTVTSQRIMPNGSVHTSTTTATPMGMERTTRVDGPRGTTIVHRETRSGWGRDRDRGHHRHWRRHHRTCKVTWRHGHRVRRCWTR